jgi:hypothetical protein
MKIRSTKEQLMREKTKRRGAQVERETWKEKYLKQQAIGEPTAESIKQEEETQDWKEMLFKQEKRTEHYKLKYIALKEEKRVWQAQALEQENGTTEHEARGTTRESNLVVQESGQTKQPSEHVEQKSEQLNQYTCLDQNGGQVPGVRGMPKDRRVLQMPLAKYWNDTEAIVWDGSTYDGSAKKGVILGRLNEWFQSLLNAKPSGDWADPKVRRAIYIEAVSCLGYEIQNERDPRSYPKGC